MLTNENYFSKENQLMYMGNSQFKAFQKCEAAAMAEINGEWQREETTALLVGSYVDAWFEDTLDTFRAKHPQILKRDGTLKSDFVQAEQIISRVSMDRMFMDYMSGESQIIMTGEIAGVPFKIKVDSLHPDKIVDLKCMKDFNSVWSNDIGAKVSFAEAWGYDIQGAIYQEIVRQNIGKKLPFFLAAVTKQKVPRMAIISIPQQQLDFQLQVVEDNAPRYQQIKLGTIQPERCEKLDCDYCAATSELSEVVDYQEVGL
ncbi:MAG: hypothetical protein E7572_13220 [Ruminococcaceae bacterium]|jgi:hypothetical protein|nr:hypothetical protein [Oscillospiraceae bacterium]